jgi:hypothetical protein
LSPKPTEFFASKKSAVNFALIVPLKRRKRVNPTGAFCGLWHKFFSVKLPKHPEGGDFYMAIKKLLARKSFDL